MEPVSLHWFSRWFDQTRAAFCPQDDSSGPTIHYHHFNCNWFKLTCLCKSSVYSELALLGALCSYASFHCWPIQVYTAKVSTHAQSQTKLLPPLNGKTVLPSGREQSRSPDQDGSDRKASPIFAVLSWSFHSLPSALAAMLSERKYILYNYLRNSSSKWIHFYMWITARNVIAK